MQFLQIETIVDLLSKNNVTVIGLLLALCGLFIWDKARNEKKYNELLKKHHEEQLENKKLLIEIAEKSIIATEKNTQAITSIKDVINAKL